MFIQEARRVLTDGKTCPGKLEVERRLAKRFDARDRNGNVYTVEVWAYVSVQWSEDGTKQESVIDVRTIRTTNGLALTRLGKGWYEEGFSGLVLKSDDPDAE